MNLKEWKDRSDALQNNAKKLEKTFEKNADPNSDGSQAGQDAQDAGSDSAKTSSDQAKDAAEKGVEDRNPELKTVKEFGDKVLDTGTKVADTAKIGFFKFIGIVTALFTVTMGYFYVHPDPATERSREMLRVIDRTKPIIVSEEEFNLTTANLFVPSAPPPVISTPLAPAVPAPLPPAIAAVAEQPVEVVEEDSQGNVEHGSVVTVEQAYRSMPRQAQQQMISEPPPKIEREDDDWSLKGPHFCNDCLGAIDKEFGQKGVSITNGDGSATISVHVPH